MTRPWACGRWEPSTGWANTSRRCPWPSPGSADGRGRKSATPWACRGSPSTPNTEAEEAQVAERFAPSGGAAVVRRALEQARNRGDRRLGTEHLLLGVIGDPQSDVARGLGVDLESAHAALDALDRAALASIGLEIGGLRLPNLRPARKRPP